MDVTRGVTGAVERVVARGVAGGDDGRATGGVAVAGGIAEKVRLCGGVKLSNNIEVTYL